MVVILFGVVDIATSAKHRKHSTKQPTPTPTPTASPKSKKASPTPSPTPKSNSKRKKTSPTPTPDESPSATETPSAGPEESPGAGRGKKGWPNVSLSPNAIEGYEKDPPKVRKSWTPGSRWQNKIRLTLMVLPIPRTAAWIVPVSFITCLSKTASPTCRAIPASNMFGCAKREICMRSESQGGFIRIR